MNPNEHHSLYLRWDHVPELRSPLMIAGFFGWSDAGNLSSDTLSYMVEELEPRMFATLTNEPFMDYTLDRPVARITEGVIREIEAMTTELAWWSNPDGVHDLIFVLGKEPHLNWLLYGQIFLGVMERLKVKRLYTVGGVQDTISHAAPPRVSIAGSSAAAVEVVCDREQGMDPAEYYGPVSIHTCLLKLCGEMGIEGVSLWGHVPAYLQKNPRLVARMISILNKAADMECPVETLLRRAVEMDRRINEIIAKDPSLKQFVEGIENGKEEAPRSAGADKIIRLNDFVRRDTHKDPKP